jgi:hypothetical protein
VTVLLDLMGRISDATRLQRKVEAIVRASGDREPRAWVVLHGILTMRVGYADEDPMQGLVDAQNLAHFAAKVGDRRIGDIGKPYTVMYRWHLGIAADTDHLLTDVTLSEHEAGLTSSIRPFVLAWMFAERGSLDEARRRASSLIEAGQKRRLPVDEGRGHWALAEVLRRAGDLDAADAEIQAALALLRLASALDTPGALASLAAIRLAQGRPAEALAAAREGMERYAAIGACGFFRGAFLRLIHARCLELAGDHDGAMAAIGSARERLFVIAAKISDPELRQSFLEAVPENREILELAQQWLGAASMPAPELGPHRGRGAGRE